MINVAVSQCYGSYYDELFNETSTLGEHSLLVLVLGDTERCSVSTSQPNINSSSMQMSQGDKIVKQ